MVLQTFTDAPRRNSHRNQILPMMFDLPTFRQHSQTTPLREIILSTQQGYMKFAAQIGEPVVCATSAVSLTGQ